MTEATNTEERNARMIREGMVVSNKMNQTAVIAIVERVAHHKYSKMVVRTKKLYAHDATNYFTFFYCGARNSVFHSGDENITN